MKDVIEQNLEQSATTSLAAQVGVVSVITEKPFKWTDINDPFSPELDRIAGVYGFHELAVEDCRNFVQPAKLDEYDNYIFVIINSIAFEPKELKITLREIDVFVGRDYVVTSHHGLSRAVIDISQRLPTNRHRLNAPDAILHALLDSVVDRYLPTLDLIGDTIDELEDRLMVNPDIKLLDDIFALKRSLLHFRRAASAQRELLNMLMRRNLPLIRPELAIYFRDVYDHVVRSLDLIETYRDLLTGALDVYLTQMANRTNDIVKGLSILATIMLPLTLITGFFGMNFSYIPLAQRPYGIWYVTASLFIIAGAMLWYFRRKGWL